MNKLLAIAGKELRLYFGSPMALIFVGVFLALTLFVFFWVDSFFARGIADVRALFAWMPLLMILLAAALTMHLWSREEASGNLQVLLTMPLRLSELVAGKFLAALTLVALALGLTVFLPITVAALGNLDWGPVIGGYLAALLLASSYIAIGMFVSSRTDNQLVALIGAAIICGAFHAVGSPVVTDFFGASAGDLLRQFGTASRFESIQRGVIDFRDLLYYASLTIFFLALNVLSLDSKRWSGAAHLRGHRVNARLRIALIGANLLVLNLLFASAAFARIDLTQHREYSLSDVTGNLLSGLQEPLLVRGYFSEDSHPALAPLVPRLKDTLREYQLLSNGKMQLDFIDPLTNPELEREANQVYGIRPTPLQVNERGGLSLVNVYFDVLIAYGDQTARLNFSDLIEIQDSPLGAEIRLRNLEYDLTSAIQRVVYGFQTLDAALASLDAPARLTLYLSSATLPEMMLDVSAAMQTVSADFAADYPDALQLDIIDMSAADAPISEQELFDRYQIQPVAASFFAEETFYLHLVIEAGGDIQVIYPAGALSQVEIRNAIEAALKRSSAGFLKVIGLWTPPASATDQWGQQIPTLQQYAIMEDVLRENYDLRRLSLDEEGIPVGIDVLILLSPHSLTDMQRYAIDQYLMRGGAIIAAVSEYRLGIDPYSGALQLDANNGGIKDMFSGYGIDISAELVMDLRNAPFPQQVQRDLGGMLVTEIVDLPYPYFIDVRQDSLDADSGIVNSLPLLTVPWASTVTVNPERLDDLHARTLVWSSEQAWLSQQANPQPDLEMYPELGFPMGGELGRYPLAVFVEGAFDSHFMNQPSPYEGGNAPESSDSIGLIERSPDNARLVVIGSSEFVNDNVYQIAASFGGDRFYSNLQLIANAIDSFTEDASLASIRSRGSAARILPPISQTAQNQWALLNYAVALLGLLLIGIVWQIQRRSETPMQLPPPNEGGAS